MSKKISDLPEYSGINNPDGRLPISIAGTTYKISPNKLQGGGGGGGATNLGYTPSPTDGTVTSSTGSSATIPLADNTNAGLFSPAEKSKLASITAIFTTALKTAYDNAVTWISTNGTNVLNHLASTANPHATTASQVGAYTTTQVDTLLAGINTNAVDKITVKLSEAINKGQAVYISGANGTNILVSKASNASEATSSKTLGLLETTGATNAIVNVVTDGLLDGLNTSTATIGDPVWLGTNGDIIFGLTNKPVAPAHLVYIGVVSRVSATVGEIIVKVQNGFELKEIHDVLLTSVANEDFLRYETSSGLWKNIQITGAFILSKLGITTLSGSNTGDNATNTQYSGLATSKEDTANKSTSTGDIASSVKFPVWSAVVSYVTGLGYLLASTASSTYATITNLALKQDLATATTGSAITFTTPQVYNTATTPTTAVLTSSLTGAKIGVVQKIYSNRASFTFPSGWVLLGSQGYTASVLNIIYAEWTESARVEYWIVKG